MEDWIGDINYISDGSYKGGYTLIDHSYYFFRWNRYSPKNVFDKVFSKAYVSLLVNGYQSNQFVQNKPSDGIIERVHFIRYPNGGGKISKHYDPHNISFFNCNIYGTEY